MIEIQNDQERHVNKRGILYKLLEWPTLFSAHDNVIALKNQFVSYTCINSLKFNHRASSQNVVKLISNINKHKSSFLTTKQVSSQNLGHLYLLTLPPLNEISPILDKII